jgi:hypothetical protein
VLAQSSPDQGEPNNLDLDPGEIVKVTVTVENVTALYGVDCQSASIQF